MDELIHAFKYGRRIELAGPLGRLLAHSTPPIPGNIDIVMPVPLSKERLADRGFNQSVELASALAGTMHDRFHTVKCWRKRNTPSQARLGLRERRRNLLDAFCVETRLDGLSVAIVDDVVTTGTTLDALAEMLKKQGANRVEAWALARTLVLNT
jgi:ComF family protein